MNFRNIKVKQLKTIHEILTMDLPRYDKDVQILSYLTGKTTDEIDNWKFYKSNFYRDKIAFLYGETDGFRVKKYIFVKGRFYKLLTDIEYFSASRLLSLKAHLQNGGADVNLAKLASQCYKPVGYHGDIYEHGNYTECRADVIKQMEVAFEDARISQIAGGVFFYSVISKRLNDLMLVRMMEAEGAMMEISQQARSLQNIGVGYT